MRATRAQADRILYKAAIREILENQPNLDIFQQAADDLIVEGETVKGVVTQTGIRFDTKTVVLTTGTFLGGTIHIGLEIIVVAVLVIHRQLHWRIVYVSCRCALVV